ncbi:MAG: GNAT family N-acetyltransferase [Bacteroidetes bacterium]|nr:GNAT family N-acetyltransferase [Bacteroidota bacterium]
MIFRKAIREDLPSIIEMLANDFLGATREKFELPLPQSYYDFFELINSDSYQELTVAEIDGEVIGTMQLTFLPNLNFGGSMRLQIESVRVRDSLTGKGIGTKMMEYAIEKAKEKKCRIVQLTTDKRRKDAHRFYEKLGFTASHEGMKLHLY